LMHLPIGTTTRGVDDRIARALASSVYFRTYHLVLMDPTPFLPRILEALDWANARHIGVYTATLGPRGSQSVSIVQKRAPEPGPITDRVQDFLRSVSSR